MEMPDIYAYRQHYKKIVPLVSKASFPKDVNIQNSFYTVFLHEIFASQKKEELSVQ